MRITTGDGGLASVDDVASSVSLASRAHCSGVGLLGDSVEHGWRGAAMFSPILSSFYCGSGGSRCDEGKKNKKNALVRIPCSSRCVDGLLRGTFIGAAWGVAFHNTSTDVIFGRVASSSAQRAQVVPRSIFASVARSSASFGLFMATFNGVQCCLESAAGTKHWTNDFFGGFTAMTVLGVSLKAPKNLILPGACATGLLTSGLIKLLDPERY